jgi:hypothetical protein
MLEGLLVGAIVTAATAYAVWALLPASLRLRAARRFGAWARRPGRPTWVGRAASAMERAALARLGGCSDCGAAQPPRTPPGDDPPR